MGKILSSNNVMKGERHGADIETDCRGIKADQENT